HLPGLFSPTFYAERKNSTKAVLLSPCQLMVGMIWQACIKDFFYRRLGDEPLGQGLGVPRMGIHPQAQGLQAFEKYPSIKGTHTWAGTAHKTQDFIHQVFWPCHHPTQAATLT